MATTPNGFSDILDVMRDIQQEGDAWKLADALVHRVPKGEDGFDEIISRAADAGLTTPSGTPYTKNTLRQYRDAAKQWSADKRIPGVSFTIHRELSSLPGGITAQTKLLKQVADASTTGRVTAKAVRDAVNIAKGKAPKQGAAPSAGRQAGAGFDAVDDLKKGGKQIIVAIPSTTDDIDLDKIKAGLNKVLLHVESLQAKAAQKRVAGKKASAPKASAPPAPAAVKQTAAKQNGNNGQASNRRRGDLRDL